MKSNNSAVTLLELLMVIVILAIVARIAITRFNNVVEQSRSAAAFSTLSMIVSDENAFFLENSTYTNVITNLSTFDAVPISSDFTFSVPSTNATTGYAQAARINANSGRRSYSMCLKSATKRWCNAANCVPGAGSNPAVACPN